MAESSGNKRIAKNTIFLYIRTLFTMCVALYTTRVVLDKLGEVDFGIYGSVCSVATILGFLNGTLTTGTSRFLTFDLGTGDTEKLKSTFSTTFFTHLILALGIAIIMETGGLWYLNNKLLIPEERIFAAHVCFHISVIVSILSITQVPYTSVIVAHENMGVYAYIGVFEAVSKLLVVYLLSIANWDKLILYSILLAVIQLVVMLAYRFFCNSKYAESKISLTFNKHTFKKILGFSSWALLANIAQTMSAQGVVVLINTFFSPVIVTAQSIANQISSAMMQFVNNFRMAINPQIIKKYAVQDYEGSRKLTLESSVYVFDLLLLIGLPLITLMEPILNIWLIKVPEYAVIFAQYVVARQIIDNFNAAFYIPMVASGELQWNSYAAVFVSFLGFFLLYILLWLGCDVMYVQYITMLQIVIFSFLVKPLILYKKIAYPLRDILGCIRKCLCISIFPIVVCILISNTCPVSGICQLLLCSFVICASVLVSSYYFLPSEAKGLVKQLVTTKLLKRKS